MNPFSRLLPIFLLFVLSSGFASAQTPLQIAQQAYLKASNASAGARMEDYFGYSVAVSGDTVVVGAVGEDSSATGVNGNQNNSDAPFSGAVFVFVLNAGMWTQQAYLKASNTEADDNFGVSVGISGDTIVVGAHMEGSSATGVNGNQTDNSSPRSGAAYLFVRSGTTWTQQAYLKASNTGAGPGLDNGDLFGLSVAISGDTVVVGANEEDSSATGVNGDQTNDSAPASGAAYVFVRNGIVWNQQAYLKASNTGANDRFGGSVSISGNAVVVGASTESGGATGVNGGPDDDSAAWSGAAYVFIRNGTAWTQQAYLKASNTGADDRFGTSVAIDGDTVVVGAIQESSHSIVVNADQEDNSATWAGAAYVFVRSGTEWSQQAYLKASNAEGKEQTGEPAGDQFGSSVSISGNTVVVGALVEDSGANGVGGNQGNSPGFGNSGAAYLFARIGTTWSQQSYLKASNTGADDLFGCAVAVSGHTVVTGAFQEDSNATRVNGNQDNNSAADSGAAYIFTFAENSTLEEWRNQHFGSPANTGDGADGADPDHDGLPNLLEFATAHNPLQPEATPGAIVLDGNSLEFSYPRNKAAMTELQFTVEWSDSLAEGTWSTAGVGEAIVSDDGSRQQVKATVPAGGTGHRFVRLRAATGP